MKTKKILFSLVVGMCFFTQAGSTPPDEGGKVIFVSRCAACHNVNKILTGPALSGVDQRHSIDWIINFVRSSQTMVKKGDKDAVALFEKFKITMPDHPDLTPDNIKSIVEYIKTEAKPATGESAPFAKPVRMQSNYRPLSLEKDYYFFILYIVVVAMLIAALLFAVRMKDFQRKMEEQKNIKS